ncbi:glycosyltransferase family 4 protein [Virgibacillus xinjiangensis]|uniref:Glycosyltransferase family 4 protein n=1 Tax=Virgibacillus xinjiangensis TaxID=393090 RepID=A0ABV7CUD7_9BACI
MKIWLLNHHATGNEGRHPSFSKYFSELGVDVTLLTSSFLHNSYKETQEYKEREYYKEVKMDNYKKVFFKTPSYSSNGPKRLLNQLCFSYRAYRYGREKLKTESTPNIIMGSSVHLFTALAAYLLSRQATSKFVFEIRDIWPQTLIDLGALNEKSVFAKLLKKIEGFLYKKADLIVSVLPNAQNHIEKYQIDSDKIVYVPNGIDYPKYKDTLNSPFTATEARDFFRSHRDNFIVTFTGAHGLANGLTTVVKAAHELEMLEIDSSYKSHLLLVGDGPEKEQLVSLTKQYRLNNITFLDKVPRDQVGHILNNSDCCLFHLKSTPVFKYGLSSNKLFDYMMSEKPMLFAVDTSFDFAKEAENGLSIPSDSPSLMAKSIKEIKEMGEVERGKLGENGKRYVEQNHDYYKLTQRLLNIFKERFGS